MTDNELKAIMFDGVWPTWVDDNSEQGTTIDDYRQSLLFHQENASVPYSNTVDEVQPGALSSILMEPSYQNWLPSPPDLTFQPEPSFQPEPPFQQEYSFQPELSEVVNKTQSIRLNSDSPAPSQNPTDEVPHRGSTIMMPFYQELPPSRSLLPKGDIIKMIGDIPNYGLWFEWLQKDSLAFIRDYDKGIESSHPFQMRSVKVTISNTQKCTRRKKSCGWLKHITTIVVNGKEIDTSKMPEPVCSCTGTPRSCDRYGEGGWASACCTASLSMYPLPLYTGKSRIARKKGRKMSSGTYARLLKQMIAAGHNLNHPIDLKGHWCGHGFNSSRVRR